MPSTTLLSRLSKPRALQLALLLSPLSAAVASAPAWAQSEQSQYRFDIAPGALEEVIAEYSRVAGVTVSFAPGSADGRHSPGVKGQLSAAAALQQLLHGSGLQSVARGENSYILQPVVEAAGAMELGATTIEGQGMGEMTENSGSYTTGAVSVGSKTPTSLRNTPQSVSVITNQYIQDKQLTTLSDALKQAPGITVQNDTIDTFNFYSRGFNIDSIQIDGASPMALSSTASAFYSQRQFNMLEYDHIEILRGANALFGGVGDPGGTINLVRKRALPDFQLKLEASAGSWDNYRTQVDVTGPLTESKNVRGRLAVSYTDRQYFVDNMGLDSPAIYGVIEADLTPDTTFTLGGFYERRHGNTSLGLPRYSNGADIGLPRHTSLGQTWSYKDITSQEIFTKLDHYFANGWKLNLAYTSTHDQTDALAAVTTGALNPVTLQGPVRRGSYNYSWSDQDLFDSNLSGSFEAFGHQHDFVLGADYQRVTSQWRGAGTFSNVGVPINVFDPVAWDPNPISFATPRVYSPNTQEQYGLYSRLTLQLADPLKLILGGRMARYHFEQVYKNAGVVQSEVDMREPTRFVPYVAGVFELDEQWSLYSSYSKIFKPQQSYLKGPVGSNSVVEPMVGKTFEVGIKGEHFDGALNTSMAVFYTKRENGAVLDPSYPQDSVLFGGSCCYLNQGEVISKGFEVQASGEISQGWNLAAGYVYNNKNRTSSTALSTVTPKHEFKLWTTYQLPASLSDWTVGGGVRLQSATYVSGTTSRFDVNGNVLESNIPFDYKQAGYAIWDGLVTYRVDDHWTLALNANNIFDKTYYQTVSSAANGNYYGEPRNYMLTLRGEF